MTLDILRQPERVAIGKLRTDGGTQPRAGLDQSVVQDYSEQFAENSWPFPPVVAFYDGESYWLADGFHRTAAALLYMERLGWVSMPVVVDVRQGERRDAILYSVGANFDHGLQRTNEDKRRAVLRLLEDEEWGAWSDREIGRRARVSDRFVNHLRKELSANGSQIADTTRTAMRGGVAYTIDTTHIGKATPAPDSASHAASQIATAPTAKLLVDWTDDDWADYQSESVGGIQDGGDAPSPLSIETPRERRIAQAQNLPATTYNVILADPPWQYNNTGVNGAAANHYDTMSLTELGGLLWSLDIKIADNAVLFLWVTNPMLQDAFELINNWGFTYKTNIVWVKDRIGTGFYVRGKHELLLICTKGAMTPIDTALTPPISSVIVAPTQEHSRKPDQVHRLIEQLYPDCNYIELFARRQRAGWDVWGNEVNR